MNSVSDVFKDISGLAAPNARTQPNVLKRIALRKDRANDFSLDWNCHSSVVEYETRDFSDFCTFLLSAIVNGQITKNTAETALQEVIDIYPDDFDIFENLSEIEKTSIKIVPHALKMAITR